MNMARISRRDADTTMLQTESITLYNTAVYARLSIEDNGVNSDSIESQIYMLEKFVGEKPYLAHYKTFFDNGATGTNFDRQGFNDMMEEVRKGNVNCIVVKDLSRFGRNYIETGDYLDKIFPYLGVRFISVNDNFDSNDVTSNEALMVALKSLLHDIYAKDISRKICTIFDVKKRNGEFMGKLAPYGYEKSPDNKHKLIINEETAGVIKDIFKWRLEGMGVTAIARKLNDMGIPSQYKLAYEKGVLKGTNGENKALWRASSILGILTNYNYIGCIVQRKTEKAQYKGGKLKTIPKSDWNIIRNTHEPIIDEETFNAVGELIANAPKRVLRNESDISSKNILRGLVICGDCSSRMERGSGNKRTKDDITEYRFYCGRKYIKNGICCSRGIREDKLKESVLHVLKTQIKVLYDAKKQALSITSSSSYEIKKSRLLKEIVNCDNKLKNIKLIRKSLYEDYRSELLSEREYLYAKEKYEKEFNCFSEKLAELDKELSLLNENTTPKESKIDKALSYIDENDLTDKMCKTLIEKIVVSNERITVHFAFCSEYEELLHLIKKFEGR